MMKYTIRGTPVTKKNSPRIILVHGKPRIIPSKQFVEYEKAALYQLMPVRPHTAVDYPVNVKCVYYMPTARKVDLVNLLEATLDILVDAHVLADDNAKIVVGHDGSRVEYRATEPRAEIEITEAIT